MKHTLSLLLAVLCLNALHAQTDALVGYVKVGPLRESAARIVALGKRVCPLLLSDSVVQSNLGPYGYPQFAAFSDKTGGGFLFLAQGDDVECVAAFKLAEGLGETPAFEGAVRVNDWLLMPIGTDLTPALLGEVNANLKTLEGNPPGLMQKRVYPPVLARVMKLSAMGDNAMAPKIDWKKIARAMECSNNITTDLALSDKEIVLNTTLRAASGSSLAGFLNMPSGGDVPEAALVGADKAVMTYLARISPQMTEKMVSHIIAVLQPALSKEQSDDLRRAVMPLCELSAGSQAGVQDLDVSQYRGSLAQLRQAYEQMTTLMNALLPTAQGALTTTVESIENDSLLKISQQQNTPVPGTVKAQTTYIGLAKGYAVSGSSKDSVQATMQAIENATPATNPVSVKLGSALEAGTCMKASVGIPQMALAAVKEIPGKSPWKKAFAALEGADYAPATVLCTNGNSQATMQLTVPVDSLARTVQTVMMGLFMSQMQ